MQTRRDQVQAHTFVAGRLVSAMLRAEPDAPNTPLRRFIVGTFCGVMAGILLIAGFGVFGFIKPGGKNAFREPGALIVEKETGARYVFVDGELKPVLNFASAKLILGDQLRVVNTSRNSLKGLPHGLPVGIPTAPDALPEPSRLEATNWQVCSAVRPDVSGEDQPFVTLRIGGAPAGTALGADRALVVRAADGTRYLAWNDRRLLVPDDAILAALGYSGVTQHLVGAAWLNALPAGPDLRAPIVRDRGEPGPAIGGRPALIGQLFQAGSGAVAGTQFFLLTGDGLAALTATGAALVLGDSATKDAYPDGQVRALPLDAGGLASAPRSDQALLDPGLPTTPPRPAEDIGAGVPCLEIAVGGEKGAEVRVAATAAPARQPGPVGLRNSTGGGSGQPGGPKPVTPTIPNLPPLPRAPAAAAAGGLADEVTVEPGGGLLIRALPSPGVADGAQYLLVDTGVRYPLPDDNVAGTLGYNNVSPVPVPTTLLGLIPAGQPLDPAAAKITQPLVPQNDPQNQAGQPRPA